jgi:hypothetical protein
MCVNISYVRGSLSNSNSVGRLGGGGEDSNKKAEILGKDIPLKMIYVWSW